MKSFKLVVKLEIQNTLILSAATKLDQLQNEYYPICYITGVELYTALQTAIRYCQQLPASS